MPFDPRSQVTDIEMGEMVCDTLEESEDAQYLKFAISSKEVRQSTLDACVVARGVSLASP